MRDRGSVFALVEQGQEHQEEQIVGRGGCAGLVQSGLDHPRDIRREHPVEAISDERHPNRGVAHVGDPAGHATDQVRLRGLHPLILAQANSTRHRVRRRSGLTRCVAASYQGQREPPSSGRDVRRK